jgi:hypothetical protein
MRLISPEPQQDIELAIQEQERSAEKRPATVLSLIESDGEEEEAPAKKRKENPAEEVSPAIEDAR